MTIPPNTIKVPGDTINVEHRELHQLHGKTIRKAVFNLVAVEGQTAVGDVMIACSDGSAIRITASGSVVVELLP